MANHVARDPITLVDRFAGIGWCVGDVRLARLAQRHRLRRNSPRHLFCPHRDPGAVGLLHALWMQHATIDRKVLCQAVAIPQNVMVA